MRSSLACFLAPSHAATRHVSRMAITVLMVVLCGAPFLLHAQSRPVTANPLQTLPTLPTPSPVPRVHTQVQAPAESAQLQAVLAAPLTPRSFNVVGVHAVPFAEIQALFQPLVGKSVRVADVVAAANRVAEVYQKHGYALSFAFVPGQDFTQGRVRVLVVEGYVADVTVKGDAGNLDDRIRRIAEHIVHERPLRQATFERYLQVMGLLPGVHVAAQVPAPTTTDGATHLILTVTRTRYNVTNGADFTHPGLQSLLGLTEYGLTSLGEQLGLNVLLPVGPADERLVGLTYLQPLGSQGWQGKVSASHYEGSPDTDSGLPLNLQENENLDQFSVGLSDPLFLSNHANLTLYGGLYATQLTTTYTNTLTGARLIQFNGIRGLDIKLDGVWTTDTRSRQLTVEVAHGFDALGASAHATLEVGNATLTTPADPSFTRYDVTFAQSNAWGNRFGTAFSVTGQYSPNSLPSTEQISFGGQRYGLAYDPGTAVGDYGWAAAAELNRHYDFASPWLKQVTPYVIVQYAHVGLNTGQPLVTNLGSAGVGVRWTDKKHYAFDLTVAQPTADKPIGATHRDPRLNLAFSYQFK
jgi:hemolysin activation/secretion protein